MTISAPAGAMPAQREGLEGRASRAGFIEHFERVAAQYADRTAVSIGDQVVSYRELDRWADELAAALEQRECGEETIVAVCCERSIELVAALLAVMKTNAAFLPLDPRFPAERLKTLVRRSRARVVVSQPRYAPVFAPCDLDAVVIESAPGRGAVSRVRARRGGDPASLAYVIYTSGSTGVPKGVAVAKDSFYRYVLRAIDYYRFDPDGVSVVHTSTGVDLTLTSLCCPLLLGMRIVLVPDDEGIDGLVRLLASRSEPIALLKLTPSHLVLMASAGTAGGATWECDALIVGGEQLTAGALRFWERQCPGSRVFNEYGPTEATIGCCVTQVQARESRADAALPIGQAIRDVTLHLRHPCATGAPSQAEGELFIGGPCLARGYLNAPAATAERFLPDPYREGERLYRTGDWVKRGDDGLTFVGRRDRQLKINGVRIELGEVEAVLQEYPGVRAAAAASVREADGQDRLVAFVCVADPGTRALEFSSLARWMRERLVDAAVPGEFYLVDRPTLAVSGKIDHQELIRRRHAWTRVVDRFVPPQTPIEELLASLWRAVLDVDEIGIDDSFFALDGNSMKAIQFVYGAKKRGLILTTRDLFERQTIRRLAQLVAASPDGRAALPPLPSHPFALVDARDRARMPDDVVDAYPLTLLQAGTVLESTMRAGSGAYHNVNSYHLECAVTPAAIAESLARATRRHPILRTAYDYVNYREPLQLVYRHAQIPLIDEDIGHLSDDEQARYVGRFIEAESRTPFDWMRPPLLRVFIHRRGPRRLQLTLSKHHSILDGWSAATLLAEIATNAIALSRGAPPVDGPLEATFRDAVALERQALQSAELSDFWKRTLHQAPSHALRSWGDGRPRPDTAGGAATARSLAFGAEASARLKKLATRAATPLKSVLLAIHLRVLAQMTGETDLVTGVVANGRPETADGDRAIGLFINTVPFRLAIDERLTWVELIQRVFQEERRVFPYQRYPMARIKRDLGCDRLFSSVFYYTHFYVFRPFRNTPHLRCVDSTGFEETEIPFTSAFSLHPLNGEISLRLHFHVDHFSDRQIASVVRYFERAVAAVVTAPERPVLAESLLSDADTGGTATRRQATPPAGEPRPVSALFLDRVRQHPDRLALVGADHHITYDAMRRRVEGLYAVLAHHGIGPGSIVGIYETDPSRAIASMLAVNRAGACFAILDPQWPPARLDEVVSQLEPPVVLAGSTLAAHVPRAAGRVIETSDRSPAYLVPPAPPAHDPDELAYIVFTSGSTGAPKGVMVGHRSLSHSTAARLEYYQPGYERFLLLSRLTFDSAFAGIWGTLCGGGTLYVLSEDRLLDVGVVSRLIHDEAITHVLAIPSLYRVLLPELTANGDAGLRAAIVAGEELARDLVQAHRTRLPAVALYNEYGPSEGTVWATVADLSADGFDGPTEPVSIGDAVAHLETFVLDAGMRPTAPGATGDLYLGGGIARGYYRSPRVTAARFVPNPCAASESDVTVLYRTGDRVRRSAAGDLQFVGRSDNQVKVRGFRIELEEIERAFCESFPVRDAIAMVHERAPGRKRICVVYAPLQKAGPGAALDLQDVRAALGRRLPPYTLPEEIAEVESLPRLPNHKLDRKAAEALRPTQAPQAGADLPCSEVERVLAGIWRETLMVQTVGVNQSFFDVGGDSLLANQVALRAERLFGVKIPLNVFYQAPTIAAHAGHLTSRGAALGVDFEQIASVWNRMSD